jgi:hypothetical protein
VTVEELVGETERYLPSNAAYLRTPGDADALATAHAAWARLTQAAGEDRTLVLKAIRYVRLGQELRRLVTPGCLISNDGVVVGPTRLPAGRPPRTSVARIPTVAAARSPPASR